MDDREQTLAKGTRAACGHLVAKGRRVFDGECFGCAADRNRRTLLGQRPVYSAALAGDVQITWTGPPNITGYFHRAWPVMVVDT